MASPPIHTVLALPHGVGPLTANKHLSLTALKQLTAIRSSHERRWDEVLQTSD